MWSVLVQNSSSPCAQIQLCLRAFAVQLMEFPQWSHPLPLWCSRSSQQCELFHANLTRTRHWILEQKLSSFSWKMPEFSVVISYSPCPSFGEGERNLALHPCRMPGDRLGRAAVRSRQCRNTAQLTSVSCKGEGNYCENGANLSFSKWPHLTGFPWKLQLIAKLRISSN